MALVTRGDVFNQVRIGPIDCGITHLERVITDHVHIVSKIPSSKYDRNPVRQDRVTGFELIHMAGLAVSQIGVERIPHDLTVIIRADTCERIGHCAVVRVTDLVELRHANRRRTARTRG